MTEPGNIDHDQPTLDDVITPTETARPDHREHAKEPQPIDDQDLLERTQHEREETSSQ